MGREVYSMLSALVIGASTLIGCGSTIKPVETSSTANELDSCLCGSEIVVQTPQETVLVEEETHPNLVDMATYLHNQVPIQGRGSQHGAVQYRGRVGNTDRNRLSFETVDFTTRYGSRDDLMLGVWQSGFPHMELIDVVPLGSLDYVRMPTDRRDESFILSGDSAQVYQDLFEKAITSLYAAQSSGSRPIMSVVFNIYRNHFSQR